jgi:hypothetical protein
VTFISVGERIGSEKGREEMLRNLLRAKFQEAGEALLSGRQLVLTDETARELVASLVNAVSLEEARRALEQVP